MAVPFVDLKAQYHSIKAEIDAALIGTMESCAFTLGPEVAQLEKDFAVYAGTTYAAGVNNGTSALHLALLAAGVGPGDEVITVPFTFIASASAIHYTGAKPVFVDIDPVTFTMDPAAIEAAITPRTKAIVPVHLFGQMADMDPIMAIAKKHNLFVLEDAAQAHGAEYNGKRAGSIGDAAGFSFYPGKNMGAAGEGGMTVTPHAEINRKVRMLRDWGAEKKYHHEIIGYNMRLEGIQGAVLRVKLKYIEKWTEMRRDAAKRYADMFAGTGVVTPVELANRRHVYHIYADPHAGPRALDRGAQQEGHPDRHPLSLPAAHAEGVRLPRLQQGQFPHSEKAAAEVLSLPMYPGTERRPAGRSRRAVVALAKQTELQLA